MTRLPNDAGKRWLARNDPMPTRKGKAKRRRSEANEIKRQKRRKRDRAERQMLARPILKGVE